MTITSAPIIKNSAEARLDEIVLEIRKGLQEINEQIELHPKTGLQEASAVSEELQAIREYLLAKWLKLATKVRDQISQIAQRNSDDDYREIVPLAGKLDAWSQDEALANEDSKINQLRAMAEESRTVQANVRQGLVGEREARAREHMALAEQARDFPFVRALPLLKAHKLWAEVVEIVKEIEEPPPEQQTARDELEKCNQDMLRAVHDLQTQHTRQEVAQLASDWRDAKFLEDREAALSSIRQLLPLSPTHFPIPDDLLDDFWHRHEMSVANKVIEIRVQHLLERATATGLGLEKRSSALREAQGLVQNSDKDLLKQIDTAWNQLRSNATGSLEEHNRQFEQFMAEKAYDKAAEVLSGMALAVPLCDDKDRWSQQLKELGTRLDKAKQPSEPEIALQRLIEMMDRAIQSEPQQMYDALESIEEVRRKIPSDLSEVPNDLKRKAIDGASELSPKLPQPAGPAQGMKRRYIDDICKGKIGLQTKAERE